MSRIEFESYYMLKCYANVSISCSIFRKVVGRSFVGRSIGVRKVLHRADIGCEQDLRQSSDDVMAGEKKVEEYKRRRDRQWCFKYVSLILPHISIKTLCAQNIKIDIKNIKKHYVITLVWF